MTDDGSGGAVRISDLFANIMHSVLGRELIAEISSDQVSLAQVHALRYIWLHETVRIGDLADGLGVSYPSATNMVSRLERLGLAERLPNPSDRREVGVRLTVSGDLLTNRMEQERQARIASILERLPPADREALVQGLTSFVLAAAGDDPEVARGICLRCGSRSAEDCPVAEHYGHHLRG